MQLLQEFSSGLVVLQTAVELGDDFRFCSSQSKAQRPKPGPYVTRVFGPGRPHVGEGKSHASFPQDFDCVQVSNIANNNYTRIVRRNAEGVGLTNNPQKDTNRDKDRDRLCRSNLPLSIFIQENGRKRAESYSVKKAIGWANCSSTLLMTIGSMEQSNGIVNDVRSAVLIMTAPIEGMAGLTHFRTATVRRLSFQRQRSLTTFSTVDGRRYNDRVELMTLARVHEQSVRKNGPGSERLQTQAHADYYLAKVRKSVIRGDVAHMSAA
ncbi:hypothetical protein EDD85DRAFT_788620 [Armillaria nabsnona]|nr:hypothetical protein EDD85DRAFT_788620 [Armillaria nabsnona]